MSAVGGIIYRRSLFVLPTVDSKVLGTWRTGAHRHRVANAIDFVAIAITLAMLATSPTTSRVLAHGYEWIYEKKTARRAVARLFVSAVGGIIYRRTLFVLPTVDSKVLGTWRTGAHRHRVADAIDFVAIAITLAMLATSPTTSRVLALEIVWIYEKK